MNLKQSWLNKLQSERILNIEDDQVSITKHYKERKSSIKNRYKNESYEFNGNENIINNYTSPSDTLNDEDLIFDLLTLNDLLAESSIQILIPLIPTIDSIQSTIPSSSGVPDSFLSVSSHHMRFFNKLNLYSISYIWKSDCEPCTSVRETLDEIINHDPINVLCTAINGPSNADYLQKSLDVNGAPTVLFIYEGVVETRIVGPYPKNIYTKEIDIMRNQSKG